MSCSGHVAHLDARCAHFCPCSLPLELSARWRGGGVGLAQFTVVCFVFVAGRGEGHPGPWSVAVVRVQRRLEGGAVSFYAASPASSTSRRIGWGRWPPSQGPDGGEYVDGARMIRPCDFPIVDPGSPLVGRACRLR